MNSDNIGLFQNERAQGYDNFVHKWIPNYQFLLNSIPSLIKHTSQEPLLVVGCGTGNEIEAFKKLNRHWSITGVDQSPHLIIKTQSKFSDYTSMELIDGEVKELPISSVYSAATLLLVLHFIRNDGSKLELLRDISVRLNQGAPLIIFDIFGAGAEFKNQLQLLNYFLPADVDEEEKIHRLARIESELFHISETRLNEILNEAGFESTIKFYQCSIYGAWITKKR